MTSLKTWAYLGLLAAGCTSSDVSVGGESGEGLDRCVGVADGCKGVKSETAAAGTLGVCPDEAVGRLERDYSFKWSERVCPPVKADECGLNPDGSQRVCFPAGGCSTTLLDAKPAADGSIWLAANASGISPEGKSNEALWLGHVGSDGSDLGFFELAKGTALRDNSVYYSASIATNADSEAYVLITGVDPGPNADAEIREHTWLERYDAHGHSLGGAWDLPGLAESHVQLDALGRVVIAGDAMDLERRAIAAALNEDGELLWSQPKLPSAGTSASGFNAVAIDALGNVFVQTQRNASKAGTREFGVIMLDSTGKLLWDRKLPISPVSMEYQDSFVVDADGNFTTAFVDKLDGRDVPNGPVKLLSYDKQGNPRWAFELPNLNTHLSVNAATGDVYLSDQGSYQTRTAGVLRISKSGACERLSYSSNDYSAPAVDLGPDGRLYSIGQWEVGRFKALNSQ